jgi:hypothetical protein
VRNTIATQGVQVVGEGALANSNTTKTYAVRSDTLDTLSSTTTVSALQTAIRALDQASADYPCITADVTSATVNDLNLSDTSLGIS